MAQGDIAFEYRGTSYTIVLAAYPDNDLYQIELWEVVRNSRLVSYDVGYEGGSLPKSEEGRVKMIARFIELCDNFFDAFDAPDYQDPEVLFRIAMEKHIQIDETGRPRFV